MTYLGNTPTTQSFISGTDYFNGTGAQTAFTLSRTVASINDIQVTVNNVVQQPNDAYTISGTTLTMTSAPSAGTNNVYVRYLSTTTQAITPSQNTVSWNTLDSNIQQDLGVMYKNRIINGNMVIDQRNAGASITPTDGSFCVDRWKFGLTQSSKLTAQQSTVAPTGFINSLLITSSSAYSVTSTDEFEVWQPIEGLNISDLAWGTANAKTVTLSFWVRSSLTGTFGGIIRNNAGNRVYPFTYTINSANTFEYKTITITGDTTGTWLTTNGIGMYVWFSFGAGSSKLATAGAWTTSGAGATGQTNLVGTNGATWYITGVQLEVGTQATAFSTAGGSYGTELALCQRYFQSWGGQASSGSGYDYFALGVNDSSGGYFILNNLVAMRTGPTLSVTSLSSTGVFSGSGGVAPSTAAIDVNTPNNTAVRLTYSATAGTAARWLSNGSTAPRVQLSAEL